MAMINTAIPYPDFQLNEVIDPEQFDANNKVMVDKINEIVTVANTLTDGDGTALKLSPIGSFTSTNVNAFLQELVNALGSVNGSAMIGSPSIGFNEDTSVGSQLRRLMDLLSELTSTVGRKANNSDVYTRSELEPYLKGGDTTIRYDVYTIVSIDTVAKTFLYKTKDGDEYVGTIGADGSQTFELFNGTYTPGTNQVKAIVNDTLHRSVASGGLVEVNERKVSLTIPAVVGNEITFEYFERVGVSGEAGVVLSETKPTRLSSTMWYKLT